jgi:uncharacterized protein (DUF39 family)
MKPEYLVGTSMLGYGVTLTVGIGIPIPVLDEEIAQYTAVKDTQIFAPIVDYSRQYPYGEPPLEHLGEVNYAELKSGKIKLLGKEVPTGALSSYLKAKEIAEILKEWIKSGKFLLTEPVDKLPSVESGLTFKFLKERPLL